MLIDIYMKFREDSLNIFLSYRADTSVTDRQTDARWKNMSSPPIASTAGPSCSKRPWLKEPVSF